MTTYREPVDIDAGDDGRRFAVITDDALDNLRRLIGVPIADTVEPWCYEVTHLRHQFNDAVGALGQRHEAWDVEREQHAVPVAGDSAGRFPVQ